MRARQGLILVLVGGCLAVAGCVTTAADEQGIWCRDAGAGAIKALFLDGVGLYSIMDRDAAGGVTVTVDQQAYEIVIEDGVTYWHSWIGSAEYASEITALDPGQELILDGTLVYSFVADHDLDYDVASLETCGGE